MLSRIQNTTRGALYKHLLDNFTIQFYLQKSLNPTYRKYLSKFRLSAHSLNIEKGRYNNTNRRDRICNLCNSSDIEDEFHFILKCLSIMILELITNVYQKLLLQKAQCV